MYDTSSITFWVAQLTRKQAN